ncbi:hypothetical protein V8D89_004867 [Ganoderma adspersum]
MVLLQILDEGSITAARLTSRTPSSICLTSNLGSDILARRFSSARRSTSRSSCSTEARLHHRAIARVVRTAVLFPLAQKLIKGTIRDWDTVQIRASEDGKTLEIKDNHPPDPTIAANATPVEASTLENGDESDTASA